MNIILEVEGKYRISFLNYFKLNLLSTSICHASLFCIS